MSGLSFKSPESSYPCCIHIPTLTEADDIHSHYYCNTTRNKEHHIHIRDTRLSPNQKEKKVKEYISGIIYHNIYNTLIPD